MANNSLQTLCLRPLLATCAPAGTRSRLSVLIFHRVGATMDPLFPEAMDANRFNAILGWISAWFNVLPLHEAIERLNQGRLPARPACITFDDGYADNYLQALPILKRHRLHATFFIATGFLNGGRMFNDGVIESVRQHGGNTLDLTYAGLGLYDTSSEQNKRQAIESLLPRLKYLSITEREDKVAAIAEACDASLPTDLMLTWEQLRSLQSSGMGIGAHTVNHPILARCDADSARAEISRSRDTLTSLLGEQVTLFAYPNGKFGIDYYPEHARMVADLGFDGAVSTNSGASRHGDDTYQIRRFTPWDRSPWRFGLRMARNLLGT